MGRIQVAHLVVLTAIAALLSAGLCLLDDGDASDLCVSLVATSPDTPLPAGLTRSDAGRLAPISVYRFSALDRPAPPPRA